MNDKHSHEAASGAHGPIGERRHFFDDPRKVSWTFRLLYAACAALMVADLIVHRHVVHPWEGVPGFYAVYGFVGIVVLVLLAKQLRRVVMRDEEYYDAG